jgi:hypothetical protein
MWQWQLSILNPNHPSTGEAVDIPTHVLSREGKKKREIDVVQLIHVLAPRRINHAFVEQVGAMPGQGVSRAWPSSSVRRGPGVRTERAKPADARKPGPMRGQRRDDDRRC